MAKRATVLIVGAIIILTGQARAQRCQESVGHWGYGPSRATAWFGELALIASGPTLLIMDFRLDASQKTIGEIRLPGDAVALATEGDLVLAAVTASPNNEDLLVVLDLADPTSPRQLSSLGIGLGIAPVVTDIAIQGTTAYVTSRTEGLVLIDLTYPARPRRLAALDEDIYPETVAVRGPNAYIGGRSSLWVVDVSNPTAPAIRHRQLVGSFRPSIELTELSLLYLTSERLMVFDLGLAEHPVLVGELEIPGNGLALGVSGYLAFVTEYEFNGTQRLLVIDTGDPLSPLPVGSCATSGPAPYIAVRDGAVLLSLEALGSELFDVTDPALPEPLMELPPPAPPGDIVDVASIGNFAFLADRGLAGGTDPPVGRLRVVDLSEVDRPVEVGQLELSMPAARVATYQDLLLLTRGDAQGEPLNLDVVDVSQPDSPSVVGNVELGGLPTGDIAVSGNHAYVADHFLRVIDLSDPSAPTLVGSTLGSGGYRHGISVDGDHAYLAAGENGLCVVDISDPTSPVELSCTELGGSAWGVAVLDGFAYLSVETSDPKPEWEDELVVFDLGTPAEPVRIASLPLWGAAGQVNLDGARVLVGSSGRGLLTVDVSNPSAPILSGITRSADAGIGAGARLLAVAGPQGLDVLDNTACQAPAPTPDFAWSPQRPTLGEIVVFTDISAGSPIDWAWDLAGEGLSLEQHPRHSFEQPGRRPVTLAAGNPNGTSSTTRDVTVQSIAHPLAMSYIIPAAAHVNGAAGTRWRSNVALTSRITGGSEAILYLMKQGHDNTLTHGKRVTLPHGSTALDDVVSTVFDEDAAVGAVLVTSTNQLTVSSRTSTRQSDGSFGQFVPSIPADHLNGGYTLIHLTQNDDFRTNLGLVNRQDVPLDVWAFLVSADGTDIAHTTYNLEPYGHLQVNEFIKGLIDQPFDDGFVVLLGGGPSDFLAYASTIDNTSGDPVFIHPSRSEGDPLWIPAAAHTHGKNGSIWRTDLEICNALREIATYRIELYRSRQGGSEPASETFTLGEAACVRYSDVIDSVFNTTTSGALRIVPETGYIYASSRTYTTRPDGGTYGQFIAAVPERNASQGTSSRLLNQISQSPDTDAGYRTNLGLMNTSADPVDIHIAVSRADFTPVGELDLELGPFEHRQLNHFLSKLDPEGLENAIVELSTSQTGASFLSYASVVDNVTGDAIYIPDQ